MGNSEPNLENTKQVSWIQEKLQSPLVILIGLVIHHHNLVGLKAGPMHVSISQWIDRNMPGILIQYAFGKQMNSQHMS